MSVISRSGAWLIYKNGSEAPHQTMLERPVTCVGRASDNDVVVRGEQASTVSAYHLEIRREGERYLVHDRNSTNGTYLDDRLISESVIEHDCVIRLGPNGPEFRFEIREPSAADLDATIAMQEFRQEILATEQSASNGNGNGNGYANGNGLENGNGNGSNSSSSPAADTHEQLVLEAVEQVRSARGRGEMDQTAVIFRNLLHRGIKQSSRPLKRVIGGLVVALVAGAAYSAWAINDLQKEKSDIDAQIAEIESRLRDGGQDSDEIEQLIGRLSVYQNRARLLKDNLLYQFTDDGRTRIYVQDEIETLLTEFGATEHKIPPEFVDSVQESIERYQGPDRPHIKRTLGRARDQLDRMRKVVEEHNLPGDLAYMVLVESAFINGRTSPADAAGFWQFRADTAQALGLVVNDDLDERFDLEKSTQAAAKYIRSLILEFGSGNSVMLALAAYNTGPTRIRRAVRKVDDPIKQRNFWYLYSTGALPQETRDYVPRIFAAIIIGRHPEQFGF